MDSTYISTHSRAEGIVFQGGFYTLPLENDLERRNL
jgi:hypothetical protein